MQNLHNYPVLINDVLAISRVQSDVCTTKTKEVHTMKLAFNVTKENKKAFAKAI